MPSGWRRRRSFGFRRSGSDAGRTLRSGRVGSHKKQHVLVFARLACLSGSHEVPPFTLHKVHIRSDSEKLPTASTCFNMLKLPTYSGWTVTKKKLEFVIEQGAGFELD